jgi:LacI family transcriptional regulator
VVAVDPHTGPSGLPTVDSDNLRGARLAVEHLLSLGHRRIAMLTGREDLQSARLRERGFREAMAEAGVPVDEELVLTGDYDPVVSEAAARRLLSRDKPPSAVFAANDTSAIATVEVAWSLGLTVPEDLSVVGFDNIPESALNSPPLTTVSQPIKVMGRQAVDMLVRLMRGEEIEKSHVTLDTHLVVRGSTCAPR